MANFFSRAFRSLEEQWSYHSWEKRKRKKRKSWAEAKFSTSDVAAAIAAAIEQANNDAELQFGQTIRKLEAQRYAIEQQTEPLRQRVTLWKRDLAAERRLLADEDRPLRERKADLRRERSNALTDFQDARQELRNTPKMDGLIFGNAGERNSLKSSIIEKQKRISQNDRMLGNVEHAIAQLDLRYRELRAAEDEKRLLRSQGFNIGTTERRLRELEKDLEAVSSKLSEVHRLASELVSRREAELGLPELREQRVQLELAFERSIQEFDSVEAKALRKQAHQEFFQRRLDSKGSKGTGGKQN